MDRLLAALAAMLGLATFTAPDHEQLRSETAAAVAYAAALPAVSPAPAPIPDTGDAPQAKAEAKPTPPQIGDVVDHPQHGGRYVYRSVCRNGVCEDPAWHWEWTKPPVRLRR
jgi:hypothetical protein